MQLKNGLKVLLVESHKSPVVSVQMWVNTGSADEEKSQAGISHFIEHLVFKGTEKFKVGEIANIVEGSGGELNAYTSFDQTVFYVTISKEFTSTAMDVISQMMGFPQFDPQEIDNEREVVIEEIKRGLDSSSRMASQLMFSQMYKKHTYGRPVIGYDKVIKNISVKKIIEYYQQRYVPENMFLVVVGDFKQSDIKSQVKEYFEKIPKYKIKKVKRPTEPAQKTPRIEVKKTKFPENYSYISWPIPNIKHKDTPALDILSMILGGGENSHMVQKLRIEKPLVKSIGVSTFTPKDSGLFAVVYDAPTENQNEVMNIIFSVLEKIKNNPPTEEEMRRAITLIQSDQFYSLETVDGLSRQVGHYYFYMQDENYFKKYLEQIYKLTPADISKAAKKYLVAQKANYAAITKDDEKTLKKNFQSHLKSYAKNKLQPLKTKNKKIPHHKIKWDLTKIKKQAPKTEKIVLDNGVSVLFRAYPDSPVVSVRCAFLGGVRIEPENKKGLCELVSRVWTSGTINKSEQDISTLTENMAASLSAYSGRNTMGLSMELLKPFEKEAADLYFEVLTEPSWPEAILEREKVIILEQIKAKKQHPSQIAIKKFHESIFGNHPYSKDLYGDEDSVQKIQRQDMIDLWKKMALRKNLTLIVTGDVDKDLWLEKAKKITSLKEGDKLSNQFLVKQISKDEKFHIPLEREQSHVVLGYKGLTIKSQERFALQIMESILSGQGGRLFIELRDKMSLAYSVSPIRMEGLEDGYFGGYIACSPEKVQTSIEMLKKEFNKLVEIPVGPAELERAKKYLIGRHDIDLQKARSIGSSILYDDVYGIDYNETFSIAEKYQAVTAKDIQSVAKKIFNSHSVTVVVGKD